VPFARENSQKREKRSQEREKDRESKNEKNNVIEMTSSFFRNNQNMDFRL
jgi:hypothetical protein